MKNDSPYRLKLAKKLLRGQYYCDRMMKGHSLKPHGYVTLHQREQLRKLADKISFGRWQNERYHFYTNIGVSGILSMQEQRVKKGVESILSELENVNLDGTVSHEISKHVCVPVWDPIFISIEGKIRAQAMEELK